MLARRVIMIATLVGGGAALRVTAPAAKPITLKRAAQDASSPPRVASSLSGAVSLLPLLAVAPAEAAESLSAVPSAFAAYGHYLGLVLACFCLATERLTIKPEMTAEEEQRVVAADAIYGIAGLLIVVTGYLRVTQYGKGWEFYQHEPIFWGKMLLVAVRPRSHNHHLTPTHQSLPVPVTSFFSRPATTLTLTIHKPAGDGRQLLFPHDKDHPEGGGAAEDGRVSADDPGARRPHDARDQR
jgi:multisubunit Na+/H+ antiporter MnhF subunit